MYFHVISTLGLNHFAQADKMRTAAATNKSAHEKLLSETRLQFRRMNSELSLARSERNTLRTQIERSTSQQAAEQTASVQQLASLRAQVASLETALTQAKREAEDPVHGLARVLRLAITLQRFKKTRLV